MEPRAYDVELPTHTARVLEWGPADGRLLVAMHGFPDTAWTWRRVAPLLAEAGWRVAAPFLRGYAPSGIPTDGDYSIRTLMDDAIALHDRLGGDDNTPLVGHDWGAITTNALAGSPESPYHRHVSLAVPPFPYVNPSRDVLGPWLAAMARQPFRSWYIGWNQLPGLAERTFEGLTTRLWRWWSPGYDPREDLAHLRAAVPDRAHAHAVVSYYRALAGKATQVAMAEPTRPLLYLHGAVDGCLDPRFFPIVADRMPAGSAAALIPDAGHFLQLEQPDPVAARILDFLA